MSFNREFFRSPDDWALLGKKQRHSDSTHCLKETLQFLLEDHPQAKVIQFDFNCSCHGAHPGSKVLW